MPQLAVLYDANVYRGLSAARSRSLNEAERACGVVPIASQWVCVELLAHLADRGDASFRAAWAALRRLATHCSEHIGTRQVVRFHVGADEQILVSLFGHSAGELFGAQTLGALVGIATSAESPDELDGHALPLQELAKFVHSTETRFVAGMQQQFIAPFDETSRRWAPELSDSERRKRTSALLRSEEALRLAARMFIEGAARMHNLQLLDRELTRAQDICVRMFPVALRLQNAIAARLIENPDFNLAKHANWIWDVQLAFSASPSLTFESAPIWLVTTDGDILLAAAEAGAAGFVRSLDDYQAVLQGGDARIRREIAPRDAA